MGYGEVGNTLKIMVYIHGNVFVKLTTIYSEYRAIKSITNASVLILKQCLGLHYKILFGHKNIKRVRIWNSYLSFWLCLNSSPVSYPNEQNQVPCPWLNLLFNMREYMYWAHSSTFSVIKSSYTGSWTRKKEENDKKVV